MKKLVGAICMIAIFFAGCSSKSVFEPQSIEGDVKFDSKIPADIKDISLEGAVLENNQLLTKDGLSENFTRDGFRYIYGNQDTIVVADDVGLVLLIDKKTNRQTEIKFSKPLVSASLRGDILAGLSVDNSAIRYDLSKKSVVFRQKLGESSGVFNAKIANPYFLNDLIIYPSLDGKLVIFDINTNTIIRNIAVDSKKLFANIIFLDVIENRLVASTDERVISLTPTFTNSLNLEIRDILFLEDVIYIFTKDGRVILTDADLNVLKEKKFPFAHFVGVIYGKFIYAIEKEGYIIALDRDLITSNVFKLPSKFENYSFTTKDLIFYEDNYFKLSN